MQAWDGGGRGRGEAVTDTPRADWLASRAGNAHLVRGGIFGEADIPIDAEDLCRFLVSEAPSNMVLRDRCRGQLTISLTGSSGTVSSISTSRSVSFSTNENQSFSLWRKSGSCTVYFGQSAAAMARILRHIVAQCSGDSIDESSRLCYIVMCGCDMLVLYRSILTTRISCKLAAQQDTRGSITVHACQ